MIHRGNGKSHAAPVGVNRLDRSSSEVSEVTETRASAVQHTVEGWVAAHPVACIAAAAALGVMLGWIIKRR